VEDAQGRGGGAGGVARARARGAGRGARREGGEGVPGEARTDRDRARAAGARARTVRHSSIVLGLALAAGAGCRSGDRPDPVYDPARTLVEVVATLQAGRDADLYRYDAPKDVSGDNLFRASLARLARYDERLRDPAFRPAVAFAQA